MSLALEDLCDHVAAQGRVARVVITRSEGSAPREAGAAMLIWEDGQSGTIGGGALEWEAAAQARQMLQAGPAARITRHPLGPGLGQCCGGAVTLACEVWDAERLAQHVPQDGLVMRPVAADAPATVPLSVQRLAARLRSGTTTPASVFLADGWLIEPVAHASRSLWIWGAGHVGRALVGVLAPLPDFAITWVDTADERFPPDLPDGVIRLIAVNLPDLVTHAPTDAEHLILTYSHAIDLELCHRLLGHGFRSAGLIGSATKWARFRSRLRALGHADAAIARITCPIGEPGLGKHPQAIAVGVAAALLQSEGAAPAVARTGMQ